jgi:hypothetical protein
LQHEAIEHQRRSLTTGARIWLWFACLLVILVGFSLVFAGANGGGFLFAFWITAVFAVPVGCLYLPLVVKLPDAQQLRWLVLIAAGALIGPVGLAGLCVVASIFGDAYRVWVGDGEDPGFISLAPLALIVGSLTSVLYVIALKIARCRPLSACLV